MSNFEKLHNLLKTSKIPLTETSYPGVYSTPAVILTTSQGRGWVYIYSGEEGQNHAWPSGIYLECILRKKVASVELSWLSQLPPTEEEKFLLGEDTLSEYLECFDV